MIKIVDLSKNFGKKVVLKNFSVDFESGRTTVVLGRSGTGKSVLLKIILRLLQSDGGTDLCRRYPTPPIIPNNEMMDVRRRDGDAISGFGAFRFDECL